MELIENPDVRGMRLWVSWLGWIRMLGESRQSKHSRHCLLVQSSEDMKTFICVATAFSRKLGL